VRKRKEGDSEQAMGTHFLGSAERGRIEETKSKRKNEGHSLSGETPGGTSDDILTKRARE
jgi:hypothetical protein